MLKRTSDEDPGLFPNSKRQQFAVAGGVETSQQLSGAPVLHSVPKSILPVINHPFKSSDFFTDLDYDVADPKIQKQIDTIVRYFHPPTLNYPTDNTNANKKGVLIPFIFPPPPQVNKEFNVVPPLPFPPPNYMPYPLVSEKSSLTPDEVFASFLEALTKLPRIDMVTASAAGSLFDMRAQAHEEGFTISEYEEEKKRFKLEAERQQAFDHGIEDDDNDLSLSSKFDGEDINDAFEEYRDYASQVDTTLAYDVYNLGSEPSTFELNRPRQSGYANVTPRESNITRRDNSHPLKREAFTEFSESPSSETKPSLELPMPKLPQSHVSRGAPSSVNKEKRISFFKRNLGDIAAFETTHEQELYLTLKRAQLERLRALNSSKVLISGDGEIEDEELRDIRVALEEQRDMDLVGTKLMENYEYLNNALVFYQDSHRMYRQMNSLMNNKLSKLKNFFEFQKQTFTNHLKQKESANLFDVKTKESAKLYAGISRKDIGTYLRDEWKRNEGVAHGDPTAATTPTQLSSFERYTPTTLLVHDFMPLNSTNEFNLITGDLPSHKFKTTSNTNSLSQSGNSQSHSNVKHLIFKSPLYDPITSGSDTNASDSSASNLPKRRGRRAANPAAIGSGLSSGTNNGHDGPANVGAGTGAPGDKFIDSGGKNNLKYSEALLLARIMKHFTPPQGARPDDLVNDLAQMGVQSKWPLSK